MRYLLLLILTAFVPAERFLPDPPKTDLELLQGAWILTEAEREMPIAQDRMIGNRVLIAGTEYKRFTESDPPVIVRTLRLVPNSQPKAIDLIAKTDTGEEFLYKGIYEIKGDMFRFCFALHGQERPIEFRIGDKSTANSITTYRLVNRTR